MARQTCSKKILIFSDNKKRSVKSTEILTAEISKSILQLLHDYVHYIFLGRPTTYNTVTILLLATYIAGLIL